MKQRWLAVALLLISYRSGIVEAAEVRMQLSGQLFALANDIKQALKMDPRVQGQSLSLGTFIAQGRKVRETNFGQRIETELRKILATELNDEAKLILAGTYHFVESESADNPGAEVLVITAQIQNDRGKEIIPFTREVNDTDDIRGALGVTGAGTIDPKASFRERNSKLIADLTKPQFEIVGTDRVAATGLTQWSVRLLRKSEPDGPTTPVVPQNINGLAYAPTQVTEYYEVELFNHDRSDSVAVVTIDGLDVANTFSTDQSADGKKIVWPGYFVPRGDSNGPGRILIRGWLNTIQPTKEKNNVFSFLVKELGQGAASALRQRGSVGVITVQFFEACSPGERLSGRSTGETAKGEGLKVNYTTKQVLIGENALSTISIRYNVPSENPAK